MLTKKCRRLKIRKKFICALRNCNSEDKNWVKLRTFKEGAYKDKRHEAVKLVRQEL